MRERGGGHKIQENSDIGKYGEREKGNKDKQRQRLRNTKETNMGVRYNEKPKRGLWHIRQQPQN